MRPLWLIAKGTIIEAFRKKDVYVVLILAILIISIAAMFNFFGIQGLHKFVKDISLSVTNILIVIIAIVITARQLPTELEQRTLYPFLAKPITRLQFLLGKFLGVMIISTATLLAFAAIFLIALKIVGGTTGWIFVQALYLRFLSLCVICSLTLSLSLFLTPSANVTVMLLLCLGANLFSRTIVLVYYKVDGLSRLVLKAIYFIIPHLDFFDMSKRVVHDWQGLSAKMTLIITLYAFFYTFIFLTIGHFRFRRRML
jgi:ABC-type transport system involved in multi-copper enzyme maturation permease subunit